MSDNREKILDKIKKCMALAKSGNEHEAAAALRQARALIAAHDVSDAEMLSIGVGASGTRAGAVDTPARWESQLSGRIARIFGCRLLLSRKSWTEARWLFIGMSPAHEVACYSFEVLFRQAKQARVQHIATVLKRYKRSNKTRRADLFCEGWVATAVEKVAPLSTSAAAAEALGAYMQLHYPTAATLEARDRNAGRDLSSKDYASLLAGLHAGGGADLHQGVGATKPLMLEAQ